MARAALWTLPLSLLATGCRNVERDLPGFWTGKLEVAASVDPTVAELVRGLGDPKLELRSDKSYRLTLGTLPVVGRWSVSGTTLTLTPQQVGGAEIKTPAGAPNPTELSVIKKSTTLLISADGRSLLVQEPNGRTTFTKISP